MFAHACRHIKDDDPRFAVIGQGESFLHKAKLLLLEEMGHEKPKICTIQGLLILGGRQCAIGKSSEGWLYTGMVGASLYLIWDDFADYTRLSEWSLILVCTSAEILLTARMALSLMIWKSGNAFICLHLLGISMRESEYYDIYIYCANET